MNDFQFQNTTKVYFGKDQLGHLHEEVLKYGKSVLVVYGGGSIKKIGLYDKVKKELKEKKKNGPVYPSVAYELGAQISERTGQEIRVTVPGHMQRGGEPCPYDRVIATRLGAEAAEMIRRKEYGYMVALNNNKIEKIPLADIAGKLKMVDPKSDIIREAKEVGISFGDE